MDGYLFVLYLKKNKAVKLTPILLSALINFMFLISPVAICQTRMLTSIDGPYHYFAGISEPDAAWNMPGFNDSGWSIDTGVIGYGYGVENCILDPSVHSIYMRFKFDLEDRTSIREASIFADYDDGYIAYLNGKEIVRVNVDKMVEKPAFDDTTIRSHEIEIYERELEFPVLTYYLDSMQLDSCLLDGENVLGIQVLNDSLNGSDLQYLAYLLDITHTTYSYYDWESRYKKQVDLDSTKFPIVEINTDEFGIPWKNIRVNARMGIKDREGDGFNYPGDSCNVYYGDVSIEVRGESSSEYPKRTYRFELIDSIESDTNVALLGMPRDNDWILMGPFADKAQFRNKMVYDMGRNLDGSYQPRSEFCELIINGEFLGLYCILETIKRENHRVDIEKLTRTEISGNDLTGGYILKYDKPYSRLEIVYPKSDKIQPQQTAYITDYMSEYRQVLTGNGFLDPDLGYRRFICDTALVDYLIVNEITKNADAYKFSTYFYKDRDDKEGRIHYGPLWDYDLAFGNTIFQQGYLTDGWQFALGSNSLLNVTRLFQDTALVNFFQERYHAARQGCFSNNSLMAYIDSMVNYLSEPLARNYTVWPVIDKSLFWPNYVSQSYEEEIANITNWLTDRLEWIDSHVDGIYYPVVIINGINENSTNEPFSFIAFPNPFFDELALSFSSPEEGNFRIEIIDLLGRQQLVSMEYIASGYSEIALDASLIQHLMPGAYILRILHDNRVVGIQRLIKQ
jgi:hypothetical protein